MTNPNFCMLLGRLTKDSELVSLNNGNSFVVKFSLAVNDDIKKGDLYEQRPSFFDVDFFGNYAKAICTSLVKGQEVLVTGRLRQDRWTSSDGKTSSKIVIKAENVTILRKAEEKKDFSKEQTAENPF